MFPIMLHEMLGVGVDQTDLRRLTVQPHCSRHEKLLSLLKVIFHRCAEQNRAPPLKYVPSHLQKEKLIF